MLLRFFLAIPKPVKAKPINTARAYIAAKVVILALEAITKIIAKLEIKIIPFEKASLWPRLVNCFGNTFYIG